MEIEICRLVFFHYANGNSWWEAHQTISGQDKVIVKGQYYVDQYWKRANTYTGAISQIFGDINAEINRSEDQRKTANLSLVAQLGSDGWEPTTFDDKGLVTAVKRVKPKPEAEKPTSEPDLEELLKQLASLRDAGILTQEEFDTKISEILKRI